MMEQESGIRPPVIRIRFHFDVTSNECSDNFLFEQIFCQIFRGIGCRDQHLFFTCVGSFFAFSKYDIVRNLSTKSSGPSRSPLWNSAWKPQSEPWAFPSNGVPHVPAAAPII
ncbi:hypothetical protein AB6A40_007525 [Gnathostoma spinigerum]|uniref:Uncharacterized protein n=1 Tax=Gnathostoma spinigerum TaxID=75299 RepID=A0ABD6ETN7_9BILA